MDPSRSGFDSQHRQFGDNGGSIPLIFFVFFLFFFGMGGRLRGTFSFSSMSLPNQGNHAKRPPQEEL